MENPSGGQPQPTGNTPGNGGTVSRTAGGTTTQTGAPAGGEAADDGGATIVIDENGQPRLVSASDMEAPLANLGFGGDDHKCDVLRFIILLASFAVVLLHTKAMKDHQERVFELREKLEEKKEKLGKK